MSERTGSTFCLGECIGAPPDSYGGDDVVAQNQDAFDVRYRRGRELAIQRFSICRTAADELGPRRYRDYWLDPLRQQRPELRMVPAQVMTGAVAVGANTSPENLTSFVRKPPRRMRAICARNSLESWRRWFLPTRLIMFPSQAM
jgi:hypothetical protein